jgi:hypothetical protein
MAAIFLVEISSNATDDLHDLVLAMIGVEIAAVMLVRGIVCSISLHFA